MEELMAETLGLGTTTTTAIQYHTYIGLIQLRSFKHAREGEQRNGAGLCMPNLAQLPCGRLEQLTYHLRAVLARAVPGSDPFSFPFFSIILLSVILLFIVFFLP